jgi:hypothetical protein
MLAAGGRKLKAASTQKILLQMTQLPQTREGGLSADRQSAICTMHHQDMSDVSHKDHRDPICCNIKLLGEKYPDVGDCSTVIVTVKIHAGPLP